MTPLTENDVVDAAVAVIKSAQIPVPFSFPPETQQIKAAVYNRWIFAMTIGQVVDQLRADALDGLLNGWAVTTASWIPKKVKSESGASQVPPRGFTPGFDDAIGSGEQPRQYKMQVDGTLKVWQVYGFNLGSNAFNSEQQSRIERDKVINAISEAPRLGLNWQNFEHDELKFPSISLLPFGDVQLHIAQGNIPFTFQYVVTATT
jgi:hypothetical protein